MTDPEPPSDEPAPPHRQHTPASPAEIRRKLLFGGALLLALGSVYAGLFQLRAVQYTMVGLAVAFAFVALFSGDRPVPPGAPTPPSTPASGPS